MKESFARDSAFIDPVMAVILELSDDCKLVTDAILVANAPASTPSGIVIPDAIFPIDAAAASAGPVTESNGLSLADPKDAIESVIPIS
jgi:hypothetical protein